MAGFDTEILSDLRDRKEVSIRTEKHPDTSVVIWVVVAEDEVFVRSHRGARGRWYRDLATGGLATLEVGRRRVGVRAIPVSDPASIESASRGYLTKYRSSSYAQSMVRPDLLSTTLRLEPR